MGYRYATSVGGSLTGKGANFIIIDDPLKASDAQSDAERNRVNTWFRETVFSRLDNKMDDVIIIVTQRLHEDDLSGYLLSRGGWVHLNLPAIATEKIEVQIGDTEFHRRERDDILHPELTSAAALEDVHRQLGSYFFAAQYQQSPVPPAGNMIKRDWFKRYKDKPSREKFSRIIQSWDTATSVDKNASYSVCTTWGVRESRYFLLGVNRARLEFPELQHLVVTLARTWEADTVLIEKASSGLALLQNLQNKTVSPLIPIPVESHKEVRVAQVSPIIEAGRLVLPTEADWLADFEKEILGFPSTRHDDQVDSMTQFLIWITWRERRKSPVRAWLIGGEGVRDLYRERTGIPTFGNNC